MTFKFQNEKQKWFEYDTTLSETAASLSQF